MKLLFATILIFLIACNGGEKKESVIMPGAYMMTMQSLKNSTMDTTYHTLQQLKIYTGDYMMYANFYPRDSTSRFGIGTYSAIKDTVTENVIFSACGLCKRRYTQNLYCNYRKKRQRVQTGNTGSGITGSENNSHRGIPFCWNSSKNSLRWRMERTENILYKGERHYSLQYESIQSVFRWLLHLGEYLF